VTALKSFLSDALLPTVFALDETNHELLGRSAPSAIVEQAQNFNKANTTSRVVRRVAGDDGHTYLLFAPSMRMGRHMEKPGSPPPVPFRVPIMPTLATLIASLICAALLARYISKPIHMLRTAFDQAAGGNLSLRISPQMANRNDELANLGHDFDSMAARLQTLIDSQRRLFHDISHELRSPLARLQIACGLARQHPDTVQKCLQRIEHECKRMDDLVGELLTLAKLESRMSGANETVDLNKVVTEIVDDARFEGIPSGRGIALGVTGAAFVSGKAVLLYRAIENVVRNSLKYAPRDTDIQVEVTQNAADDCVRITVDDAGAGVASQDLEAIFQPFFRASGNQDTVGHGLGLAIARGVVSGHGGTIRATNRESGGLRIEISLPLAKSI
jgi:two-component system OmpR family sensor kinase